MIPSLTLAPESKGFMYYREGTLMRSESSNFTHYCEQKENQPNKTPSDIYEKLTSYLSITSTLNGDLKYFVKESFIAPI